MEPWFITNQFNPSLNKFLYFYYQLWILRDKTFDDKLICIPIDDKQNYPYMEDKIILVKVDIASL